MNSSHPNHQTLSLPHLPDHTITTAYQLPEYELSNLAFAASIPDDIVTLVHAVTRLYDRPIVRETRPGPIQPNIGFPFSWNSNRSLFNSALRAFNQDVAVLRTHPTFLQWAAETASQDTGSEPNPAPPNPFTAGRRLRRSIATSSEIDLNALGHSTTSSPSRTNWDHITHPAHIQQKLYRGVNQAWRTTARVVRLGLMAIHLITHKALRKPEGKNCEPLLSKDSLRHSLNLHIGMNKDLDEINRPLGHYYLPDYIPTDSGWWLCICCRPVPEWPEPDECLGLLRQGWAL